MGSNGPDHPLVREYLQELDAALSTLPAEEASEVTKQIVAHLDEGPRPDDREVAAHHPVTFTSLARTRLARVRKRTWVVTAACLILLGAGIGYLVNYVAVGDLQFAGQAGWWYPQDSNREVDTSADGAQQTTVPIRSGQQQGFAVGIYNPTGWTQTIVGAAANEGSPGSQTVQLGVSVFNLNIDRGGFQRDVRFTLPGSIPPGQIRLLRVSWISDVCLQAGGDQGIDELNLRVRVGWFTRTETIPLDQGWYLSGPSHGPCD